VDSDVISPFGGVALQATPDLMLIPLLQHYVQYDGDEINLTAARLIGLWRFDLGYWGACKRAIVLSAIAFRKFNKQLYATDAG
jgi:hypothetical protein